MERVIKQITAIPNKTLALLVPTPGTHKLSSEPIVRQAKLAWTNLYKDLASFFKVHFNDLKPFHRELGRTFKPIMRIPPIGYEVVKDIQDFISRGPGDYQLDYQGYTHELMISETTILAPRIDTVWYAKNGVPLEQLNNDIANDLAIELHPGVRVNYTQKGQTRPLPPQRSVKHEFTTKTYQQLGAEKRAAVQAGRLGAREDKATKRATRVEKAVAREKLPVPISKHTPIVMERKEKTTRPENQPLQDMVDDLIAKIRKVDTTQGAKDLVSFFVYKVPYRKTPETEELFSASPRQCLTQPSPQH
jgi:hypothetical protein